MRKRPPEVNDFRIAPKLRTSSEPRMQREKLVQLKREGFAAKHLRAKGKKAMEINKAGVLELVDRRDIKFAAPAENKAVF
jgi:hypothetical protein